MKYVKSLRFGCLGVIVAGLAQRVKLLMLMLLGRVAGSGRIISAGSCHYIICNVYFMIFPKLANLWNSNQSSAIANGLLDVDYSS